MVHKLFMGKIPMSKRDIRCNSDFLNESAVNLQTISKKDKRTLSEIVPKRSYGSCLILPKAVISSLLGKDASARISAEEFWKGGDRCQDYPHPS